MALSEDIGSLVVVVIIVVWFGVGIIIGWPCRMCGRFRAMVPTTEARTNDEGGWDQFERRCRFWGYVDWRDDLPR